MRMVRAVASFFSALLIAPFLHANPVPSADNIYAFSFNSINGNGVIKLADYKGKVILIVNTASKCGFTSQYGALEKLYLAYKDRGLVIIGIPSNDFGGQEPGSNLQIAKFCSVNYGVTFPMTEKLSVSGKDAHPFYQWAYAKLGFGSAPKWNFHKYIIDRHGNLVDYFNSYTAPDSQRFIAEIEKNLQQK